MYKYVVTLNILTTRVPEWLDYMNTEHIPEVMATGCFKSFTILKKLLDTTPEDTTIEVQYTFESLEKYELYQKEYAAALQEDHLERFRGSFAAGRAIYEVLK